MREHLGQILRRKQFEHKSDEICTADAPSTMTNKKKQVKEAADDMELDIKLE